MNNQQQPFNPNQHLMQIKSRNGSSDYLPVQWRLVWFREACPEGTIETEMLHLDLDRETEEEGYTWNQETRRSEKVTKRANGIAVFRAIVKDGKGGIATGTKSEKAASFPDYIEKAETGAIGRALAALGYGTQFAPDLNEEHRIVDAPVETDERKPTPPKPGLTNWNKVAKLLEGYKETFPDRCKDGTTWKYKVLREALDIPTGPLPAIEAYTEDMVHRVTLYMARQKGKQPAA